MVCTKTDVKDAIFVERWMANLRSIHEVVATPGNDEVRVGYVGPLRGCLSLIVADFKGHVKVFSLLF